MIFVFVTPYHVPHCLTLVGTVTIILNYLLELIGHLLMAGLTFSHCCLNHPLHRVDHRDRSLHLAFMSITLFGSHFLLVHQLFKAFGPLAIFKESWLWVDASRVKAKVVGLKC